MISGIKGIENLQPPGGLFFLWVTSRATELGIECLERWGYTVVEEIVWIKTNQLGRLIRTGITGHWLNHTKEHCLVGLKGAGAQQSIPSSMVDSLNLKLDSNVIVSEVRETSRKPEELYAIIERLLGKRNKEAKKLEIFARSHNLREGWLSIGNQLPGTNIVDQKLLERYRAFKQQS